MVLTHEEFTADYGGNFFFGGLLALFLEFLVLFLDTFVVRHDLFHKVKGPHHVGVVGQGNGWHAIFRSGLYQILDVNGGLEHGKLGVVVQMGKGRIFQGLDVFLDFFCRNFTGVLGPKCIGNFFGGGL